MSEPLLTIHHLRGGYGDADTLHGVDLTISPNEVVVVVGPNGAGKSTLLKAIFGLITIRAGTIRFAGRDLTRSSPDAIARTGIAYVPQIKNIFPEMSIEENLEMGAFLDPSRTAAGLERCYTLFPELRSKRHTLAGNLSGGQRQMVAIARALMLSPRLILLDEPTAGLSPKYQTQILAICRQLAQSGIGVLLVEQHAKQALKIGDRGYILVAGRNYRDGPAQQLLADPEIAQTFLGGGAR
ncbi:MAG: ABC transporter ATP-binding protein [Hydrogenophilus sp.]|nr:ABC transporter ATP-binding protein [Hydrogenophilus sp.]